MVLVSQLRAPVGHFVDFPVPLRASEALLANDVVLADPARALEPIGLRHVWPEWLCRLGYAGKFLHDIHADAWHDVPQIPRRIPLLVRGLRVTSCVVRTSQNRVIGFLRRRSGEVPLPPSELRSLILAQCRRPPRAPTIDAHVYRNYGSGVTAPGHAPDCERLSHQGLCTVQR